MLMFAYVYKDAEACKVDWLFRIAAFLPDLCLSQVSPLVAQQLVLLIKNRLGVSMSRPVSLWCLLLLVLRRLFLPLCALFFVYFYLLLPPVSLSLVAAAAAAAAALLSLPAAAPEALSPFACCFLIPCYAFLFPVPIHVVLGIQLIICALATFM